MVKKMRNETDVSVVMPVYKVEKYIEESVKSICEQNFFGEYELILVDDGSPDLSIYKAEAVIKRYPKMNYRVVHKENGGLPSARNYGLNFIAGKYVCFIDSDDIIEEHHIQKLFDLCEEHELIASYADFELTKESNRNGKDFNDEGYEIIKRKELLNGFLTRELKIHCCSILFNTSYLHECELCFNEKLKYGEDIEFMWRLFPKLSKIGHVKVKTYKYLQRPNSIMTSQSNDKIVILCNEFRKVVDYNLNHYPEDKRIFEMLMGKAQLAFIKTAAETSKYDVFTSLLTLLNYKDNIILLNQIDSKKIRVLSWILLQNPMIFYIIVNIARKVKKI